MDPSATAPRRPFGVTVLAILAFVSGLIGTSAGVLGVMSPAVGGEPSAVVTGGILMLLGIASLSFAWGAWLLQPWAWRLGVVIWVLGLLEALALLVGGQLNTNLIVAPICLFYLFQPDVRAAFKR